MQTPKIVLPKRRDFAARYRSGEHSAWNELVKHSPALLEHADLYEEGKSELAETDEEPSPVLTLSIAPDYLHKQNISGGPAGGASSVAEG